MTVVGGATLIRQLTIEDIREEFITEAESCGHIHKSFKRLCDLIRPRRIRRVVNENQLTLEDYLNDLTAEVRAEAWNVILENYACICHIMRRRHRDAMRAAKALHLVDSETDVDESVRAALPHVLRSVAAWVKEGKPGALSTFIGWGLMSWRRDMLSGQAREYKTEEAANIKAELKATTIEPNTDITDYFHLLDRKEQYVLAMMRDGYTLIQIAKKKRVTRDTISAILKSAVQKMREHEENAQ